MRHRRKECMSSRPSVVAAGGAGAGMASHTVEGVRTLQLACLRVLLVLQAFYLINGFPTQDELQEERTAFDTYMNYSRGTGGAVPRAVQYTEEDPLTTLEDITDKAEGPTVLSSRAKVTAKEAVSPETASSSSSQPASLSSSSSPSSSSSSSSNPPKEVPSSQPDLNPDLPQPSDTHSATGQSNRQKLRPSDRKQEKLRPPPDPFPVLTGEQEGDDGEEEEEDIIPVEQRLMNHLMRNYERSVRPVKNASETVLVRMGLTLTQIFDMDEKNQLLVTNVWLDQEWDDMFLTWLPEEYGGLKVLRLPCHKLWLPDIVLYNNAAEYTDGLMPANAMITFEGDVFWPVPTKLQSTCKVDVTYFPFDEQYCRLKFGSWTYDGYQVDMVNRTTEVDLSNYVQNGEWELVEISVQRNVVFYACCPEPFPDVTFVIHIRRRTLYYMYNVIFPCIMMSALTLLVFCLPPDSGEKITMGITVLLAFSVFMLTIAEDLPETSEFIPLLSIYLTIVMAMTSVSVIMTVFVLNLHHRGPNNKPVPTWLRRLLLRRRVRRGLCFSKQPPEDAAHFVDEYLTDGHSNYIKNVSLRLTIENLAQELKEELDHCTGGGGEYGISGGVGSLADPPVGGQGLAYEGQYQEIPQSEAQPNNRRPTGLYGRHQCTKTNEEILNALKKIIERYERDDSEEEVMYEWRQVALAVDRVLFWVFLFGTLASTIVVLIVAPITKWL